MQALVVPPEGQVWRFYYYAGGQRVALRVNQGAASDLYWLLSDHGVCASANTGSTTLAAAGTAEAGELRYKPWGPTRYTSGSIPTDRRFTGQVEESSQGLYFYGARWYDAALGRFLSADTLVPSPGNVLDWDRYSYVRNNPARYTDPSGYKVCDWGDTDPLCTDYLDISYQLVSQITTPDDWCKGRQECWYAYLTFRSLVYMLQYVPGPTYILYATVQAEYAAFLGEEWNGPGTVREHTQGALARNYYQPVAACNRGSWACTDSKLYQFLSGYQPWFDRKKTSGERAAALVKHGASNTSRSETMADIGEILNDDLAFQRGWTEGMMPGLSWQWHNYGREPAAGEAIGYIRTPGNPYGEYFWLLSPEQTIHFRHRILPGGQ